MAGHPLLINMAIPMDAAKGRLKQVFKFLRELNDLRNPVPRESLRIRNYFLARRVACSSIRRSTTRAIGPTTTMIRNKDQPLPLVRIRRADLTSCPEPPASLDGWLKVTWMSAEGTSQFLDARNRTKNDVTETVQFVDDARRVNDLKLWAVTRTFPTAISTMDKPQFTILLKRHLEASSHCGSTSAAFRRSSILQSPLLRSYFAFRAALQRYTRRVLLTAL